MEFAEYQDFSKKGRKRNVNSLFTKMEPEKENKTFGWAILI